MSAMLEASPANRTARAATLATLAPGFILCVGVTLAATALERAEAVWFGRAWLEALVLAILLGTAIRTVWAPAARWAPGIKFSAKTLLEVAVVLLGASISARTIVAVGPDLLLGIAAVVLVAIAASYGIGRLLGLSHRLATLVACGNSICGNSAIAAVAPVIGATSADIACSIAFTAVLRCGGRAAAAGAGPAAASFAWPVWCAGGADGLRRGRRCWRRPRPWGPSRCRSARWSSWCEC